MGASSAQASLGGASGHRAVAGDLVSALPASPDAGAGTVGSPGDRPAAAPAQRRRQGLPPAADGAVEVWPPPPGPVDAVLAFTAHHVIAAAVDPELAAAQLPDGDLSAPMGPAFLAWLGERLGSRPGSLDVVMAAGGLGRPPPLELRPVVDPQRHPRVARALRYRDDLEVWTDPDGAGVLVLGRGLAGRRELSFEVDPARRDRGLGRLLAAAGRHLTPRGEALFAQVAPGNVASLRTVLAAGFLPVGGEVLFHRARAPD